MNTQVTIGARFTSGMGRAHTFFEGDAERIAVVTGMLGSAMFGTFNLRVSFEDVGAVRSLPPTYEVTAGTVTYTCHLCDLKNQAGDVWPVFMYQWADTQKMNRRPPVSMIELISRVRIPGSFKAGALTLTVYRPFTVAERNEWVGVTRYWFQTFPWGPSRCRNRKNADSALQWRTIEPHAEWKGQTVLDIGGAAGYHCFEASKCGAGATLVDLANVLPMAEAIGHHIECRDVRYLTADPGGEFDNILYLSVHHQLDSSYKRLPEVVAGFKARCRRLFVELIDPVSGAGGTHKVRTGYSLADVNAIMGGEPLLTYKHNVRAVRHIWAVAGDRGGSR